MSFVEIFSTALALSMDAFAVSLAAVASGQAAGKRAAFRLSFHFGLFQFLMPVVGWALGTAVEPYIARYDHWVAFSLLAIVATRMIRSGLRPEDQVRPTDPSRGLLLVALSTATSIDALAVGLSLATLRINIWYPAVIIGLVTSTMCLIAIIGARRIGLAMGARAQIFGGIVLLAVAVNIVVTHLT
ncbi:MAG: manganese efflux pump MntP family protein [bacterium]